MDSNLVIKDGYVHHVLPTESNIKRFSRQEHNALHESGELFICEGSSAKGYIESPLQIHSRRRLSHLRMAYRAERNTTKRKKLYKKIKRLEQKQKMIPVHIAGSKIRPLTF